MTALRRTASALLLVGLVVAAVALANRPTGRPSAPAARVSRIASELRCPVCQGLSVADSPSVTSADIRADIRRRIDAGQSDAQIRQAYVDRYGEWILLRPRGAGVAALLWALPAAVIVVAAASLGLALRRWRRQTVPAPSDEDRQLVTELRARGAAPQ